MSPSLPLVKWLVFSADKGTLFRSDPRNALLGIRNSSAITCLAFDNIPTALFFLLERTTQSSETSTGSDVTIAIKMLSFLTSWNSKCILQKSMTQGPHFNRNVKRCKTWCFAYSQARTSEYRRLKFWVPAVHGVGQ